MFFTVARFWGDDVLRPVSVHVLDATAKQMKIVSANNMSVMEQRAVRVRNAVSNAGGW